MAPTALRTCCILGGEDEEDEEEEEEEEGARRGTLLLSTQLSCSWTDSGVVGPSPGPGGGAWMGLRPPLRVFLFRLLADWWDKVWWLCGGGSGGRSVDWLWWLATPGRRTREQRRTLSATLHERRKSKRDFGEKSGNSCQEARNVI
ncbi:hypothetical protein EYF80_063311 [Liparis tanakae]|uniref:Uncharacterized protein n=1 Tax=Liparis tanakae TaxID=230148 RepID=A0A4Z2ECV2_9TELE|nr:hypothetical protein EYF80_063311 [Liparis tanakae]